eukprot:366313-Chlamydomonas_euryale.AAC.10
MAAAAGSLAVCAGLEVRRLRRRAAFERRQADHVPPPISLRSYARSRPHLHGLLTCSKRSTSASSSLSSAASMRSASGGSSPNRTRRPLTGAARSVCTKRGCTIIALQRFAMPLSGISPARPVLPAAREDRWDDRDATDSADADASPPPATNKITQSNGATSCCRHGDCQAPDASGRINACVASALAWRTRCGPEPRPYPTSLDLAVTSPALHPLDSSDLCRAPAHWLLRDRALEKGPRTRHFTAEAGAAAAAAAGRPGVQLFERPAAVSSRLAARRSAFHPGRPTLSDRQPRGLRRRQRPRAHSRRATERITRHHVAKVAPTETEAGAGRFR